MGRCLANRAREANEFLHPGSTFEWDLSSENSRAYPVHFPRSFISRYTRKRGRIPRILPFLINEGSAIRALVLFGLKSSWAGDAYRSRRSCRVRFISRSSHFELRPLPPIWTPRTPAFLVSVGQAGCGLLRRAPGASSVLGMAVP